MRNLFLATSAAALVFAAFPAAAQQGGDDRGAYGALSAGVSSVNDIDVEYYDVGGTFGGSGATDRADGRIHLDKSAEFRGTLGYDFGTVRADVEVAYTRSKVKSLTLTGINGAAPSLTAADAQDVCDYLETAGCTLSGNTISYDDGGRVRQLSAIANIWVDLPVGHTVVPYVGGGIGATGYQVDDEGKARFAWQLGAGAAFRVSDKVAITADYRYRQTQGANLPWDNNSGTNVGKVKASSFLVGLRFGF